MNSRTSSLISQDSLSSTEKLKTETGFSYLERLLAGAMIPFLGYCVNLFGISTLIPE